MNVLTNVMTSCHDLHMTTKTSSHYFTVTLPNGSVVTKKAGKRNYTHAVTKGDEVVGWHISEQRAKQDYSKRLGTLPRDEWDDLSIERVRVA